MSEEKDHATMAREAAAMEAGQSDGSSGEDVSGIVPQLQPTPACRNGTPCAAAKTG